MGVQRVDEAELARCGLEFARALRPPPPVVVAAGPNWGGFYIGVSGGAEHDDRACAHAGLAAIGLRGA